MITVLFLSRFESGEWSRYFPGEDGRWGSCQFLFDPSATAYDWLVVYDDIPPGAAGRARASVSPVRCPPQRTILVTTEPESIKAYGRAFAAQFGHVLTTQPTWALPHPRRHYRSAVNHWFYGSDGQHRIARRELMRGPAGTGKVPAVSVMASRKRQWFTNHAQRFAFLQQVQALMPELQIFGSGAQPAPDKAVALDRFCYHLAIENHLAPHHITEKLTDAFLGRCLPFYAGAPNAADYFPADSFVPISLSNPRQTVAVMRSAISSNLWAARRAAIEEARRRVLQSEHLFAVIADLVVRHQGEAVSAAASPVLLSRHAWRRTHPIGAIGLSMEKLYVRARSILLSSR
jgi:hypothetical protein